MMEASENIRKEIETIRNQVRMDCEPLRLYLEELLSRSVVTIQVDLKTGEFFSKFPPEVEDQIQWARDEMEKIARESQRRIDKSLGL